MSQQYDILNLPLEILHNIAYYVDIQRLRIMCSMCTYLYENIWNDDMLWKRLYLRDRGNIEKDPSLTWKELYASYGSVSIYGTDIAIMGDDKTHQLHNVGNIKAIQISCGSVHMGMIDTHSNVYMMGFNAQGQLGLGDNVNRQNPTILPNIKAKYISCGDFHTLLIDLDDNVWAFGLNNCGQLGISNSISRTKEPQQIPNFKAKQVSCHSEHTLLLDLDNNVWGCGTNRLWELGINLKEYTNCPIKISDFKARQIAAGYNNGMIDMEYNLRIRYLNKYKIVPNIKAKYIQAGNYFTCVIDEYNNTWMIDRWNKLDNIGMQSKFISCLGYSICTIDLNDNIHVVGNICPVFDPNIRQHTASSFKKIPNVKALQISNGNYFAAIINK